MKRLFVLSLVAVLSVGLLSVGAFGQSPTTPPDESDSTYVEWVIDAPMECELSIIAHNGIDFGTLTTIGQQYTASGQGSTINPNGNVDSGDRQVETSSNCEYDVYVDVTSVNAPISTAEVLGDFGIGLDSVSGDSNASSSSSFTHGSNSDFQDPTTWGGNYQALLGSAGDNIDYGSTDTAYWTMDYSYTTDYNDQNAAYTVNLEYTASVQ